MNKSNKKVTYPKEMLEGMSIEGSLYLTENSQIGVSFLSEKDGSDLILRIYQLIYVRERDQFEPLQELAAFTLSNRDDLDEFLDRLPEITGLEMLMLLKPFPLPDHIN